MTEKVFEDYGIILLKRESKFFVCYDAGHFAAQMREDEVSEQQALRLQQGKQVAYEVLLEVQRSQHGTAA